MHTRDTDHMRTCSQSTTTPLRRSCTDRTGTSLPEPRVRLTWLSQRARGGAICADVPVQPLGADEFIRGFAVFDTDGTGHIGVGQLRYVLTNLGEKLSDQEVDELLAGVKVGGDGTIDYRAFVREVSSSRLASTLGSALKYLIDAPSVRIEMADHGRMSSKAPSAPIAISSSHFVLACPLSVVHLSVKHNIGATAFGLQGCPG